jgi:hypothetical protein
MDSVARMDSEGAENSVAADSGIAPVAEADTAPTEEVAEAFRRVVAEHGLPLCLYTGYSVAAFDSFDIRTPSRAGAISRNWYKTA